MKKITPKQVIMTAYVTAAATALAFPIIDAVNTMIDERKKRIQIGEDAARKICGIWQAHEVVSAGIKAGHYDRNPTQAMKDQQDLALLYGMPDAD